MILTGTERASQIGSAKAAHVEGLEFETRVRETNNVQNRYLSP